MNGESEQTSETQAADASSDKERNKGGTEEGKEGTEEGAEQPTKKAESEKTPAERAKRRSSARASIIGIAKERTAFVRAVYSEARKARVSIDGGTQSAGKKGLAKILKSVGKVTRQRKMVDMWSLTVKEGKKRRKNLQDNVEPEEETFPEASMDEITSGIRGALDRVKHFKGRIDQLADESLMPLTMRIIEDMIKEFQIPQVKAGEIRKNVEVVVTAIRQSWDTYLDVYKQLQEQTHSDDLSELWSLSHREILGPKHKNVPVINEVCDDPWKAISQLHVMAPSVQRKMKAKVKEGTGREPWIENSEIPASSLADYLDGAYDPGVLSLSKVKARAIDLGSKFDPASQKINDAARLQLIFDSPRRLLDSLPKLLNKFKKVCRVQNYFAKPSPLGWRDIRLHVEERSDHGERIGGELQLVTRGFFKAQQDLDNQVTDLFKFLPNAEWQQYLAMRLTGSVFPDLEFARKKHEERLAELNNLRLKTGTDISGLLAEAQRWAKIQEQMQSIARGGGNTTSAHDKKLATDEPTSPNGTNDIEDNADGESTPGSPIWPPSGAPPWGSEPSTPQVVDGLGSVKEDLAPAKTKTVNFAEFAADLSWLQDEVDEICGKPPAPVKEAHEKAEGTAKVTAAGAAAMVKYQRMSFGNMLGKTKHFLDELDEDQQHKEEAWEEEARKSLVEMLKIQEEAQREEQRQQEHEEARRKRSTVKSSKERRSRKSVRTILEDSSGSETDSEDDEEVTEQVPVPHSKWLSNMLNGVGDFHSHKAYAFTGSDLSAQYLIQSRRGVIQVQAAKHKSVVKEEASIVHDLSQPEYSIQESKEYSVQESKEYSIQESKEFSVQESKDYSIQESTSLQQSTSLQLEAFPSHRETPLGAWSGAAVLRVGSPLDAFMMRRSPKLATQSSSRMGPSPSHSRRRQAWAVATPAGIVPMAL